MRSSNWTAADAERLYNMPAWGAGYFRVDAHGCVAVGQPGEAPSVALSAIVTGARHEGLRLPLLLRFDHILEDRVRQLCRAFDQAIAGHAYAGRYTAVYPIKVNQQAAVVERILAAGEQRIGLEAGSKPELMAVLGLLPVGGQIICNGYKDKEYVRLALIGQQLGHRVTLVVEKLSELALVMAQAAELGIEPRLGLRIRLASIGAGHWQNTGGEKSKFGLSASQIEAAVAQLESAGKLHWLQLLHFHLGSQVANLRDIQGGLREAAQYYVELRKRGAPLDAVDVGGGLGVDYEGTRSRSYCSMNYGLADYAQAVVQALARVCAQHELPAPDLISESGRALTAHHAVLITNVIDCEPAQRPAVHAPAVGAPTWLMDMWELCQNQAHSPPLERLQDIQALLGQALQGFARGEVSLQDRAQAETLYRATAFAVADELNPAARAHRDALDELHEKLADKFFCNFSVFQSLPDVWAIKQVFPIVPLDRLRERPDRRALIRDLTCDSDGRIDHYVDQDGVESSLPVHGLNDQTYLLGFFLVGAYQEILGDMHNLFGDTDAANVALDGDGWQLRDIERGDRTDELLAYVHLSPDALRSAYEHKLDASALDLAQRETYLNELRSGLLGYTYLA